ncbi:hypothetical protein CHF27_008450 [Romboutsia maritimum]|uniref:Uncharacterized protein n=1 Tax=Romboutsia maritimum TaxID=2020948 RepID=A0A371ISF6_9FIRM|nr:hypothetical protein CHF27_008450 [Romboutsia maritimum]
MILGIIALSNGNISLFDNKNKSNKPKENLREDKNLTQGKKIKKTKSTKLKKDKKIKKKINGEDKEEILKFNIQDINKGMKLMDLSDEDLERGMEIITRTKKYMSRDERKILIKVESVLDLVRGIKKLSNLDLLDEEEETNFFRSMDDDDKKNMMIKEIMEVFPDKRKESFEKAIDIKKKIDLFAELFLPDDFGEGGFSLSSLANINNLGSLNNLKLLGSLLRGDNNENDSEEYEYDDSDEYEEYEEDSDEYEEYEDDDEKD